MTRVAITIGSLVGGGAERQAVLLARALAPHHETRLVVTRDEEIHPRHARELALADVPLTVLHGNPLAKVNALASLLRRTRVQFLFAHLPGDTLLGATAARLARVPHVFGGIRNSQIDATKLRVLRVLHNYLTSGSISNSYAGSGFAVEAGFDPRKLIVVPNAVGDPQPMPERRDSRELRLLTVARFVEQKDHPTALRAVQLLKRRLPAGVRIRYRIAGHGPLGEELLAWIHRLRLENDVELLFDPGEVERLYRESDVFLSTSRFEGLPNTVMEAMAAWLPVVATDVGDTARLVEDGKTGFLVPAGDAKAVADRLDALARSPELRHQQGAHGRALVHERHSLERFGRDYLSLIEARS